MLLAGISSWFATPIRLLRVTAKVFFDKKIPAKPRAGKVAPDRSGEVPVNPEKLPIVITLTAVPEVALGQGILVTGICFDGSVAVDKFAPIGVTNGMEISSKNPVRVRFWWWHELFNLYALESAISGPPNRKPSVGI